MFIPVLALALVVQAQTPAVTPDEAGYVARIEAQLLECSIEAKPKRLGYEDVLQEYSLTLDETGLEDSSVECLANAPLLDSLTIEFTDNRLTALYETTRWTRPDVRTALAESGRRQRAWLEERGLLADLPSFDPAEPLSTWSAAVEAHCGVEPRSIFVADNQTRSLTPVGGPFGDGMTCAFTIIGLAMMDGGAASSLITGEDSLR